ncbi:hypothetical protein FRC19_003285 [Serendipita sp. 401]|nr:hypothetical protein FRC19_003285 [Serendipita sp. 401]
MAFLNCSVSIGSGAHHHQHPKPGRVVNQYHFLPLRLRNLLELIPKSSFYLANECEPSIDSPEGQSLLAQAQDKGIPRKVKHPRKSIYHLFIEGNMCRLCRTRKSATTHALACVRRHLNHKPYVCAGPSVGCRLCDHQKGHRRFTARSLLYDHLWSQKHRFICPYSGCYHKLRLKEIKPHWLERHGEIPFTEEIFAKLTPRA